MSKPHSPEPVKLLMAATYREKEVFLKAMKILSDKLGKIDFMGEEFDFNFTEYYSKEMGKNLKKRLVSFQEFIYPERLSEIKKIASEVENLFTNIDGSRRINLDPGIISRDNVILSSFKRSPHRFYLNEGVYGEIELIFRNGEYQPLDWTYPDYSSLRMRQTMMAIRNIYLGGKKKHRVFGQS